MLFTLLILCMYLKLTTLLPNWKVDSKKIEGTFDGNSQNIPCPYQTYL